MFRALRTLVFSSLWALAFVCASLAQAQAQSLLGDVQQRGTLRVATVTGSPPFAFADKDGNLEGFDIDIARLIAKNLLGDENKIEFVRTSFDGRWETVSSGRADFGIMGTTIYPPRLLQADFTMGYVDSGNGCLVKKASPYHGFADLNRPNVTIAFLNVAPDHKRHDTLYPKAKALYFEQQAAQYAAVLSGQASAACTDFPVLAYAVKLHPDQLRMLPGMTQGVYNNAIFMKKGDFQWWLYLNTMVNEMLHGSLYTDYDKIYEKWFGRHAPPER
jgi:polar amino acid transport system substrate-binding protein